MGIDAFHNKKLQITNSSISESLSNPENENVSQLTDVSQITHLSIVWSKIGQ